MLVDKQPFPVNIIELASKKILVRSKVANKCKGKNIVVGDPCTSNISQGGIAQKALDRKTNKSGGTVEQAQSSSRANLPDSSITDGPTPACGWSDSQGVDPTDSA
jgi:hypothetical protein